LEKVREENPDKANKTRKTANRLKIIPVFLPHHSPGLNPIELIRKSIK